MTKPNRSPLSPIRSRVDHLLSGVRFGQFASVGVVGAICDNTVLTLLTLGVGLSPELSKVFSVESAIVVMFLINEHWTFADQGAPGVRPKFRRFLTSNLVRSGGTAVQLVVFYVVLNYVDVQLVVAGRDLWFIVASVVAIGMAMTVNYLAESLITWRVHLD